MLRREGSTEDFTSTDDGSTYYNNDLQCETRSCSVEHNADIVAGIEEKNATQKMNQRHEYLHACCCETKYDSISVYQYFLTLL